MKQRGRKRAIDPGKQPETSEVQPLAPPPSALDAEASALWRSIVASRPWDFFTPGDLPLLREYCHTTATLLPRINRLVEEGFDTTTLDARDKLVRQAAALAGKMRLCVSSRTRPDTAAMRDSVQLLQPPWEFGKPD